MFSFSLLKLVMASITLTLTGNTSSLNSYFHPEIVLDERYSYSCCLLDFYSFNSIPNVTDANNKLLFSKDNGKTFEIIYLPTGSYEVDDILKLLEDEFRAREAKIKITADKATMKCTVYLSTDCLVDFSTRDSIGAVLGFTPKHRFDQNTRHISNKVINIQQMNNLRVDCDLITGSYHNGKGTHTIYEFDVSVDPGYKICEQPKHLIYLPVVRQRINTVNVSIVDHKGELVDFRGENITCRIHIKRDS